MWFSLLATAAGLVSAYEYSMLETLCIVSTLYWETVKRPLYGRKRCLQDVYQWQFNRDSNCMVVTRASEGSPECHYAISHIIQILALCL